MIYIGDIHGGKQHHFQWYLAQLKRLGNKNSIQVGDFGYKYHGSPFDLDKVPSSDYHKFIRGNHDNPNDHRVHSNYLGDFGVWKDNFFVSGAYSVDKEGRLIDISWWRDEELGYQQWGEVYELYSKVRPRIVVTHDAPAVVAQKWFMNGLNDTGVHSGTRMGLQALLDIHQPDLWVFGHWHRSKRGKLDTKKSVKTHFVALGELEVAEI